MLIQPVLEAAVPAAAVALIGGIWWLRRQKGANQIEPEATREVRAIAAVLPDPEMASRIIVGVSPDQPAFELVLSQDDEAFERATPMPTQGGLGLMSRMSACLQAVPSLLVQQAHQGRHLMEVAINSPLANAANGNHFLPFARGANGKIIEQAKLFKPEGLSVDVRRKLNRDVHRKVSHPLVFQVSSELG